MTFSILRNSVIALALSVPLAAPAAITYEYRGVTEFIGSTPAFGGKAVVATFIVDDSVAGVPVGGDPNNTIYPFSVLSVTVQIDGLSFSSRAIGDFDTTGNHLASGNRNYARIRSEPDPGAFPVMRNTLQLETMGSSPTGSYIFLALDANGLYTLGPDLPFCSPGSPQCLLDNGDYAKQTVLRFLDVTSSGQNVEFRSGNGYVTALRTVTPVPEPETWAVLLAGLGVLGFAARRRKLKDAAA